ncbi:hypothetical protein HELRODRAFT_181394 [Helobdella robusta]|uniref:Major facilitator superfamily (MFS) profile domain-containing protein n=1 Tax=Helobdella robusta TaxID=6412 RepID=T1FGY7_HELRO|nr:hypothetical protein HELRODRAFT_181394 [Helobdella robusta]ESN92519.1 hypothetical protein HELRODRAFT_181394 [Helobdella robusta]
MEVEILLQSYEPAHHCRLPPANNSTTPTMQEWIPYDERTKEWSRCEMFINSSINNLTTGCRHGWQYENVDLEGPTIVTKWDLVCQRNFFAQVSQTMFVVGIMVGAIIFTILGDKFGRKPTYLFAHLGLALAGCISAFVPNLYLFMFLRFWIGVFQQGCLLLGFVLVTEFFSADERTLIGIFSANFWAIGCAVLPLLAYILRDWVYLQVFISLSCLLNMPLFCLMPESVAWLYANDKIDETEKILKHAAKVNKVVLPKIDLHVKHRCSLDGSCLDLEGRDERTLQKHQAVKYTYLDFVRNKTMLKHFSISGILWFFVTLIYYGLSWSTAELSGDRYLNAFYNGFVEIPAYTIAYFAVNRFGRKRPCVVFYIIGGTALFSLTFLTNTENFTVLVCSTVLNMVGKFGTTGAFGIIFLYSAELFPTNLRSQAVGVCSCMGRVSTLLASFSTYMARMFPTALSLSFACMSILSAVLVMFLPETNHRPLPETIEEIEAWRHVPAVSMKKAAGVRRMEGSNGEQL